MSEPAASASAAERPGLFLSLARSYGDVRGGVGGVLEARPREAVVLTFFLIASFVLLVGSTVARALASVQLQATDPQQAAEAFRAGVTNDVYAAVLVYPLALYLMSVLVRVAARALGGQGGFYEARIAVAWAALLNAPIAAVWRIGDGFRAASGRSVMVESIAEVVSFGVVAYLLYVLSAAIAEAFRFSSSARGLVVATIVLAFLAAAAFGIAASISP